MVESPTVPGMTYWRAIPDCRLPVLHSDKSVGGSAPTRAFQYCEPFRVAAGLGRYLFMPRTVAFELDGTDVAWWLEGETMGLLTAEPSRAVQYPGQLKRWNRYAPAWARDYCPPWIGCHFEPATLQIWTGYFVETAPGWSIWLRPPANLAPVTGTLLYDGVVETDWWGRGPLFLALRLSEGRRITLSVERPLVQIIPVPQWWYRQDAPIQTGEVADWTATEWAGYKDLVVDRMNDPGQRPGWYATRARQRK